MFIHFLHDEMEKWGDVDDILTNPNGRYLKLTVKLNKLQN